MNWYSVPVLFMMAVSFYVGIHHFLLYLFNRKLKTDLYFSLLCFSIAVYDFFCIGLYLSKNPAEGSVWQHGQFFIIPLLSLAGIFFSYHFIGKRVRWFGKGALIAMPLFSLFSLIPGDFTLSPDHAAARTLHLFGLNIVYNECRPGLFLMVIFFLMVVIIFHLYGVLLLYFFKNRTQEVRTLIVSYTIFFISAISDILVGSGVLPFVYTMEYAFLSLIIMMNYSFLRHDVAGKMLIERQNLALERLVDDRTKEIQDLLKELRDANEKLKERNRNLEELADRDSLTKLLNHAAFQLRLREVFNEAKKQHRFPLAVLMMDVDYFKKINDQHGHQIGDQVIMSVADVLRASSRDYDLKSRIDRFQKDILIECLRRHDVIGRYGGDEFSMVLPYCGEKEAKVVCERICAAIRNTRIQGIWDLSISISLGAAVMDNASDYLDERELLRLADQALYSAKQDGRDRYSVLKYAPFGMENM